MEYIERFTAKDLIANKKTYKISFKAVSSLTRPGHEGFLFRVKDGADNVAIQDYQLNGIIKEIFGAKVLKGEAGESRLFRKSINRWAIEKYGEDSVEADVVFLKITDTNHHKGKLLVHLSKSYL